MNELKLEYCPLCGEKKLFYPNRRYWKCSECDFILYNNVASAVGVIIETKDGILFEKRMKEPKKGFLALPGGFTDPDESLEEACRRECLEEIGLKLDRIEYITSYGNTYPYRGIEYKTCDVFFYADMKNMSKEEILGKIVTQKSEVESVVFRRVSSSEDADKLPIAFMSAKIALKTLLLRHI